MADKVCFWICMPILRCDTILQSHRCHFCNCELQVTGTRFENPKWWHHLSSLKPVGLNALLTFALSSFDENRGHIASLVDKLGIQDELHDRSPESASNSSDENLCVHGKMLSASRRQIIEDALVHHVKRGMPLECLR